MNADVYTHQGQRAGLGQSRKTSVSPISIVAGLLFLIPGTLESTLVFEVPGLAVGFGVVGLGLLVFGISTWVADALTTRAVVHGNAAFGLGLFLVMEFFAFMAFFAGFWMMHLFADVWPPAGTPDMPYGLSLAMLAIMLVSSLVLFKGGLKYQQGDFLGFRSSLALVVVFGLVFLGLRAYEYGHLLSLGFTPASNAYGTCYYGITAFNALSVLGSTGALVAMLIPAYQGRTDKTFVTAASILWYFNTVACIFVVSQVYFWD